MFGLRGAGKKRMATVKLGSPTLHWGIFCETCHTTSVRGNKQKEKAVCSYD